MTIEAFEKECKERGIPFKRLKTYETKIPNLLAVYRLGEGNVDVFLLREGWYFICYNYYKLLKEEDTFWKQLESLIIFGKIEGG